MTEKTQGGEVKSDLEKKLNSIKNTLQMLLREVDTLEVQIKNLRQTTNRQMNEQQCLDEQMEIRDIQTHRRYIKNVSEDIMGLLNNLDREIAQGNNEEAEKTIRTICRTALFLKERR